jgi:hypothetical protein
MRKSPIDNGLSSFRFPNGTEWLTAGFRPMGLNPA